MNDKKQTKIVKRESYKPLDWICKSIFLNFKIFNDFTIVESKLFVDKNENLYVNEIAPRVHNSGHLTINAFNISQFENHVRAVCSLEKIPLKKISNAKMVNLIGNQIKLYRENFKFNENEFFFDYRKKEIKDKRKMGHITTLI